MARLPRRSIPSVSTQPEVTLEFFSFTYRRVSLPAYSAPTTPTPNTGVATEYYHSGFNHYFLTAYPRKQPHLMEEHSGEFGRGPGKLFQCGRSRPQALARPAASLVNPLRRRVRIFIRRSPRSAPYGKATQLEIRRHCLPPRAPKHVRRLSDGDEHALSPL